MGQFPIFVLLTRKSTGWNCNGCRLADGFKVCYMGPVYHYRSSATDQLSNLWERPRSWEVDEVYVYTHSVVLQHRVWYSSCKQLAAQSDDRLRGIHPLNTDSHKQSANVWTSNICVAWHYRPMVWRLYRIRLQGAFMCRENVFQGLLISLSLTAWFSSGTYTFFKTF